MKILIAQVKALVPDDCNEKEWLETLSAQVGEQREAIAVLTTGQFVGSIEPEPPVLAPSASPEEVEKVAELYFQFLARDPLSESVQRLLDRVLTAPREALHKGLQQIQELLGRDGSLKFGRLSKES